MKPLFNNLLFVMVLFVVSNQASAQDIRIETNLGDILVTLNPDVAPITVTNFMNYLNRGDYDDSIIHRVAYNTDTSATFVIQGGGLHFRKDMLDPIPADDPIMNEFSILNTRGTIAMAKVSGQANSATSQWFINTTDNPGLDDPANSGGFTVFGEVTSGMDVADLIGSIRVYNKGGDQASVPLIAYPGEGETYEFAIKVISVSLAE